MIKNPILQGFHPDPCICRKDNDYYPAVSSFEWFPGIPVYLHSSGFDASIFHDDDGSTCFAWSYDGKKYSRIGKDFDTSKYLDEFCKYGEFTGTFVGMTCADRVKHSHFADFDFFEYLADETKTIK